MGLNNLTGGGFQDMTGSPLQNGYLDCELSHDEQETSTSPHGQVVGGLHRRIFLDNNGNAVTGSALWANDVMSPASSYYIVKAYRSDGTLAWKAPQYWTITSAPSPLDLGTLVPTNPPGGGLGSFSSITLQTNEVNNGSQTLLDLHAGVNMTLTDNGSGQITLAASGGASFTTSGQGYFLGFQDVLPILDSSGLSASGAGVTNKVMFAQINLPYTIKVSNTSVYVITAAGIAATMTAAIYNAAGTTKLLDAGSFDTGTSSQVIRTNAITPVTLSPGTYLFAQGATSVGSFGSVVGHGPYNAYFINSLLNGVVARVGSAANPISGGVMPATLGALTAFTHADNTVTLPGVLFQA